MEEKSELLEFEIISNQEALDMNISMSDDIEKNKAIQALDICNIETIVFEPAKYVHFDVQKPKKLSNHAYVLTPINSTGVTNILPCIAKDSKETIKSTLHRLNQITQSDLDFMGFNSHQSHPKDFILQAMSVELTELPNIPNIPSYPPYGQD